MWELDCEESWVQKNRCFWTVVLEKTLGSLWTARRSNQSILKEFSPGCSLEGLTLKLKLQYFGHLMWSTDSLEKILMLGGIGGRRRRGQQRMIWLDGITDSMHTGLSKLQEFVMDRDWRAGIHGVAKSRTRLSNWIELNPTLNSLKLPYLIPKQVSLSTLAEASPATSNCHGNIFSTALFTSAIGLPHSFDLGSLLINTLKLLSIPCVTKLKPLAWNQRPVQTISYHPTHTSQMPCSLEESCVVSHLCACSPFLPLNALPT